MNRFQVIVAASALPIAANAATYNFYFNNTEQGDNSTAAPSVTVQSPEKSAAPAPTPTPTSPVQPMQSDSGVSPEAAGGSETLLVATPSIMERKRTRWFRLQGSLEAVAFGDGSGTFNFEKGGMASAGPLGGFRGSASFFPSPYFGLTGFYGTTMGGELEVVPIHTSGGKVELGALLGVNQLTHSRYSDYGWSWHLGTRFVWNTNYPFGLTLAARYTQPYDHLSVEAGIVYSF